MPDFDLLVFFFIVVGIVLVASCLLLLVLIVNISPHKVEQYYPPTIGKLDGGNIYRWEHILKCNAHEFDVRSCRRIAKVIGHHDGRVIVRGRTVKGTSLHRSDLLDETELLQTERQSWSRVSTGQSKVETRAVLGDGHQMRQAHGTSKLLGVMRQSHLAILGVLLEAGRRIGEHHLSKIGYKFNHLRFYFAPPDDETAGYLQVLGALQRRGGIFILHHMGACLFTAASALGHGGLVGLVALLWLD